MGYAATSIDTPYNVHIEGCRSASVNVFFYGAGVFPNNIKVLGGSIENFSSAFTDYRNVSVFGTYFETANPSATYIFNPRVDDSSTCMYGALVYLNQLDRVANLSSRANSSLTLSGNTYRGYDPSASGCIVAFLPLSGEMNLSGDSFDTGVQDTVKYISTAAFSTGVINHPIMADTSTSHTLSGVTIQGSSGILLSPLSAEPDTTHVVAGTFFTANGGSWDPLAVSAGRPYLVIWQGDRWRNVTGV